MRLAGVLLVGFATSCFNPDLAAVGYSCDDLSYFCPEGLVCTEGVCQREGQPTGEVPVDPIPNMAPAAQGCASGKGYSLGVDTAFACPGKFGSGVSGGVPRASALCASGYALCKAPAGINGQICQGLTGFFAADGRMSRRNGNNPNPADFRCQGASGGYPYPLYPGCGSGKNVAALTAPCAGFLQAIDCAVDQSWTCSTFGSLDETTTRQSNANDGVLCCKS